MHSVVEPQHVLMHLQAAGLHLRSVGDSLVVRPRTALTDADRDLIRTHRASLLALVGSARQAGDSSNPPDLSPADREAIAEAIAERAAIREFCGGEPRLIAEHEARVAMRVYRLRVGMGSDTPHKWATLLAPDCDLAEARRIAEGKFGPERVLEIHEHRSTAP